MNEKQNITKENSINIINQQYMKITGVEKVNSATLTSVVVKLSQKSLVITGSDLSVTLLDTEKGIVELNGNILSVKYSSGTKQKENFFKRIFK